MVKKKETISGDELMIRNAGESPEKKAISPLEHWKMIAETAYYLAQDRGFVGGNPMDDWVAAEKEIDEKYTVDYSKVMALVNPSEMMDQFGKVFGEILNQPDLNLDDVLESQRKNIEALTDANKLLFENAQDMVGRQTEVFRDVMERTISSMKDATKAKSAKDIATQQAELVHLGVEKGFSSMREIAESIVQANTKAFDIANQRMAENMSEFKELVQKIKGQ